MAIKLTDQVLNRLIMEALEEDSGLVKGQTKSAFERGTGMPINRRLYADKPETPVKRDYEDTAKQFLKLIYQRKNLPPQYKKQIDMFFKGQLGGVGAFEPEKKKGLYDLTLTGADFAADKEPEKKSWFGNLKSKVSSLFREHNGNIPQDVLEKLIFEVIEEAEGVTGWTGGSDDGRTRTPSQQSYFQAYKMQQDPTKLKTSADLLKLFLNDPNFPKDIKAEIKDFLPWYNKRRLDIYHAKLKDTSDEPTVKDVSDEPTVKMTQDEPKVTGATISPTVKQGFRTPIAPTTKIGEIPSDLPEPEKIAARVPTSKGMGFSDIRAAARRQLAAAQRERGKQKQAAVSEQIESLVAEVLAEMAKKGKKQPVKETKQQPKKTGKK